MIDRDAEEVDSHDFDFESSNRITHNNPAVNGDVKDSVGTNHHVGHDVGFSFLKGKSQRDDKMKHRVDSFGNEEDPVLKEKYIDVNFNGGKEHLRINSFNEKGDHRIGEGRQQMGDGGNEAAYHDSNVEGSHKKLEKDEHRWNQDTFDATDHERDQEVADEEASDEDNAGDNKLDDGAAVDPSESSDAHHGHHEHKHRHHAGDYDNHVPGFKGYKGKHVEGHHHGHHGLNHGWSEHNHNGKDAYNLGEEHGFTGDDELHHHFQRLRTSQHLPRIGYTLHGMGTAAGSHGPEIGFTMNENTEHGWQKEGTGHHAWYHGHGEMGIGPGAHEHAEEMHDSTNFHEPLGFYGGMNTEGGHKMNVHTQDGVVPVFLYGQNGALVLPGANHHDLHHDEGDFGHEGGGSFQHYLHDGVTMDDHPAHFLFNQYLRNGHIGQDSYEHSLDDHMRNHLHEHFHGDHHGHPGLEHDLEEFHHHIDEHLRMNPLDYHVPAFPQRTNTESVNRMFEHEVSRIMHHVNELPLIADKTVQHPSLYGHDLHINPKEEDFSNMKLHHLQAGMVYAGGGALVGAGTKGYGSVGRPSVGIGLAAGGSAGAGPLMNGASPPLQSLLAKVSKPPPPEPPPAPSIGGILLPPPPPPTTTLCGPGGVMSFSGHSGGSFGVDFGGGDGGGGGGSDCDPVLGEGDGHIHGGMQTPMINGHCVHCKPGEVPEKINSGLPAFHIPIADALPFPHDYFKPPPPPYGPDPYQALTSEGLGNKGPATPDAPKPPAPPAKGPSPYETLTTQSGPAPVPLAVPPDEPPGISSQPPPAPKPPPPPVPAAGPSAFETFTSQSGAAAAPLPPPGPPDVPGITSQPVKPAPPAPPAPAHPNAPPKGGPNPFEKLTTDTTAPARSHLLQSLSSMKRGVVPFGKRRSALITKSTSVK